MSRSTGDGNRFLSFSRHSRLEDIFKALQDINLKGHIVEQEPERAGLGSSCDVFRAKLDTNNSFIAVKRIRLYLLDDLSFARDLGREVRLWSKLNHPNVLPLLGYFLEGPESIPNLVSEWMKNGTLIGYMKYRPFDVYEICNMLCGVASGLHYIHTVHSMIHADIKGSNIFVSDDYRPLLADFGLSVSSSSPSLLATTSHDQKGSLRWMARELFSNPLAKHTMMTDIWAFGMVISELLRRKVPYDSIPDRQVAAAILDGQLPEEPDYRTFSKGIIFRGLWAIGKYCWHDDPLQRPSALKVLDELKYSMHDLGIDQDRDLQLCSTHTGVFRRGTGTELRQQKLTIQKTGIETELGILPLRGAHDGPAMKRITRKPRLSTNSGFSKASIMLDPLQRTDLSLDQRNLSPIIGLKNFNNWIKAVLFTRFANPVLHETLLDERSQSRAFSGRVLDIGCGKGGDLKKWQRERIRQYVGLDIADVAIKHAQSRYDASVGARRFPYFDATFVTLDYFSHKLSDALEPSILKPLFDVVSMRFCIQNAFESVQKVMIMLENVSKWLRKGGVFVGTIPNDKLLMARLDALPPSELSFGNTIYKVRFEERERRPVFGHHYWLDIHAAVSCVQEYVAHWDTFVQMASDHNLELQYRAEFHEMYAEHYEHEVYGPTMLRRMKVVDANGKSQMDQDQWDTANLYTAFAFKKL